MNKFFLNIIEYPSTQKTKVFKKKIQSWNKRKEWSIDFVYELLKERKDEITNGDFDIFEGLSDGDLLGMSYFIDNVIGTLD